jgi:hypothetical protein
MKTEKSQEKHIKRADLWTEIRTLDLPNARQVCVTTHYTAQCFRNEKLNKGNRISARIFLLTLARPRPRRNAALYQK